ncbi:MAG: TolC family protein [Planctomycetota bacterium]|nr:TolC family protein [Planctomycetota bacterium]
MLVLAGGCSDAYLFSDPPTASVRKERLREIGRLPIDQFRKPDPGPGPGGSSAAGTGVPDVDSLRARFQAMEKLALTLEDCRESALTNNLDLRVARVDPTIAAQQVSEEEAAFESAFTLRGLWAETDTPTASTLVSAQAQSIQVEPGVRIPLRTGGTARVGLPLARNKNDNPFSTLPESYTSDLELSLSHPLLRGAGRRATTTALRVARYNQQASEAQTKLEVIRQLAAVDRSYWRLYRARAELDVRQRQYELAVEQLNRARRRVNAGSASEIEVVRAEAGVADQLDAIIRAENDVLAQQREIKRIINKPGLTIDTEVAIVPETLPDPVEFAFERSVLADTAVANRMEMLELELRLAADAANIAFSKNQALPLLTMDYTYRVNGLGASSQDSFRQLQQNDFEDWSVGLNAEVPIGNEAAKSRVRRSILQRLQRLGTKDARELAIRQEVLDAIDAIQAGWQRVLAARQSTILNARALQAEQRQFDVGESTSTDVLDASARLAQSQSAEVLALTDYQIAQVDLAFATGTLLGAARVAWSPEPQPEKPLSVPTPAETIPSEEREESLAQPGSVPESGAGGSLSEAPR